MLSIVGINISFFLALLMLSKKNKTLADKILFAWLIVMGLHLSLFELRRFSGDVNYAFLLGIEIPFPLFHGPFLYLYTAAMTNQLPANKKLAFLHFITPLLSLLIFSGFFLLPAEQKIEIYKNKGAGFETIIFINLAAIYCSGIIYVFWSAWLLLKHQKNIEQEFSDTEKINLNWLRYLVYGIGFIWLIVFLGVDEWIFGAVVIFVLVLGIFGLKQEGIFVKSTRQIQSIKGPVFGVVNAKENEPDFPASIIDVGFSDQVSQTPANQIEIPLRARTGNAEVEKKKYAKSGLTASDAQGVHARLTKLVKEQKIFTEPDLTLTELASRLDIHPNYLSQVINELVGKNFYDYINTLRIEEFMVLISLPDNAQYTILSIAYECGFNSKSSFNRYFKKIKGVSPSEFLKNK